MFVIMNKQGQYVIETQFVDSNSDGYTFDLEKAWKFTTKEGANVFLCKDEAVKEIKGE